MKQWLNIFVLAFLAISPGMNADVLAHSFRLCRFMPEPVAAQPDSSCPCDNDQQDDTDHDHEGGCQHLAGMTAQPPAVPGIQIPGTQQAPPPCLIALTPAGRSLPRVALPSPVHTRPPPLNLLTGATLLLI